jgi:hypothetical protein
VITYCLAVECFFQLQQSITLSGCSDRTHSVVDGTVRINLHVNLTVFFVKLLVYRISPFAVFCINLLVCLLCYKNDAMLFFFGSVFVFFVLFLARYCFR